MVLGFDLSINPFSLCPSYQPLVKLPFAERIAALRDPQVRARLLSRSPATRSSRWRGWAGASTSCTRWATRPTTSRRRRARSRRRPRRGRHPGELAYDLLLENDGRGLLLAALANYGYGSLDPIHALITDPNSVLGLGDGGAHYGMICDQLSDLRAAALDARAAGRAALHRAAIKALTSDPAGTVGLNDRGVLAVGRKADLNVIDYDAVRLAKPHVLYDLPAGGRGSSRRARL